MFNKKQNIIFYLIVITLVISLLDLKMFSFMNNPSFRLITLFIILTLIFVKIKYNHPELMYETSLAKDDKKENPHAPKVKFSDVAGLEEIKEELIELCDFLINQEKFSIIGAKIPKGVIFHGPPGTGKTLLAKALAGETNATFFYASGSEFIEKFVGIGASRIRTLFDKAKKSSPSIIFIDELDAIGVSRSTDNNSERDQTLNQLLIELDGFRQHDNVIVIAATNRIDILDKALLRPGRFDRHIFVGNPNVKAREDIFKVHFKNKPLNKDVNIKTLARKTHGMSGAHLANIVNEAALLTVRRNLNEIGNEEINQALVRTIAGLKCKTTILNEKEKKIVAFHEAGHALVGSIVNNDLIEKISIIPHGKALGFVLNTSSEDRFIITKDELQNKIITLLAGRAAEEIIFKEISTGAQNDLAKANEIASQMVCEYGMSKYKNKTFDKRTDFNCSEIISEEVNQILLVCYTQATKEITSNIEQLNDIANVLIEKEMISGKELDEILQSAS